MVDDLRGMADEIESILERHMEEDRMDQSQQRMIPRAPDSESVVRPIPVASPSYPIIEVMEGELEGVIVDVDVVEGVTIEEAPNTPRVETPEDVDREWEDKTSPSTYVTLKPGVTMIIGAAVSHDAETVERLPVAQTYFPEE